MFTASELIMEIRDLARLFPDFNYTEQKGYNDDCSYLGAAIGNRTGMACIVGQALTRLGVTVEVLEKMEMEPASDVVLKITGKSDVSGDHTPEAYNLPRSLMWIDEVQGNQDTGRPWEAAVSLADHYCELMDSMAR